MNELVTITQRQLEQEISEAYERGFRAASRMAVDYITEAQSQQCFQLKLLAGAFAEKSGAA